MTLNRHRLLGDNKPEPQPSAESLVVWALLALTATVAVALLLKWGVQ